MRYSYEFKRECIELYREGKWKETPIDVKQEVFRKAIRKWARIEEACGPEVLRHKNHNKEWTAEERYELVAEVISGQSITQVAIGNGINKGQLYQWVRKYKTLGYNGLVNIKKGRPSKESTMPKKIDT